MLFSDNAYLVKLHSPFPALSGAYLDFTMKHVRSQRQSLKEEFIFLN